MKSCLEFKVSALVKHGFLLALLGMSAASMAEQKLLAGDKQAFSSKERSTMDTIKLPALEEEALSKAVIEGGLEAPAAGIAPGQANPVTNDEEFYLDPLALRQDDARTDLGRNQLDATFVFRYKGDIPGQTPSDKFVIRPPENRQFQTFNATTTGR